MLIGQLPLQPIKNWYVTLFGGLSRELSENQVGINMHSLANTNIVPYHDRVSVKKMEDARVLPLYIRKWFEVVPLDRSRPDALSKSPRGEIVLPEGPGIIGSQVVEWVEREPIILNNVLGKMLKNPADWSKLVVANYTLKKRIPIG